MSRRARTRRDRRAPVPDFDQPDNNTTAHEAVFYCPHTMQNNTIDPIHHAALLERIDKLTSAMQLLAGMMGARLTRQQLADRLGIHRNTIATRLEQRGFPRPCSDGKWLLSEIVEWEQRP